MKQADYDLLKQLLATIETEAKRYKQSLDLNHPDVYFTTSSVCKGSRNIQDALNEVKKLEKQLNRSASL